MGIKWTEYEFDFYTQNYTDNWELNINISCVDV